MLQNILRALCCALFLLTAASTALAAPQTIEAEGVYTVGDNDSPKIARDAARQEAMRSATEQAGVYVESYTETQNLTLTKDEVRMVAGTVLRVLHEDVTPELVGDVWRYRVHLVCEVDTSKVDLAALAQNKAELARLQKERDELKWQNDELLARYEQARGMEKAEIGAQLEESYKLGRIFDDATAMIQRGDSTPSPTSPSSSRIPPSQEMRARMRSTCAGAPTTSSAATVSHSMTSTRPTARRTQTRPIPSGSCTATAGRSTLTWDATTMQRQSCAWRGTPPTRQTTSSG